MLCRMESQGETGFKGDLGDQLGQLTNPLLPFLLLLPIKTFPLSGWSRVAAADTADAVWPKQQPPPSPLAGCLMKGDRRGEKQNKAGTLETVLRASRGAPQGRAQGLRKRRLFANM